MKIIIELKGCGHNCPIEYHAKHILRQLEAISSTIKNNRDSIRRMYIE